MEELMRNLTLALAAASCLAFAISPALATSNMSNAKSGSTNQMLAQAQYNTKKKSNEVYKQQNQTGRRGWGSGQ
jgi:hypothetical protein